MPIESFHHPPETFIYYLQCQSFASIPTNSPQQLTYQLSDFNFSATSITEESLEMKRAREEGPVEALDMASCLLLLSTVGESDKTSKNQSNRGFACKTCNREFSSFQALGGHRASHKKPRLIAGDLLNLPSSPAKPKIHECSVCGLEFAIGQALGGHMRRHRTSPNVGSVEQAFPVMKKSVGGKRVFGLDLNLTPMENDLRLRLVSPMVDCFL